MRISDWSSDVCSSDLQTVGNFNLRCISTTTVSRYGKDWQIPRGELDEPAVLTMSVQCIGHRCFTSPGEERESPTPGGLVCPPCVCRRPAVHTEAVRLRL